MAFSFSSEYFPYLSQFGSERDDSSENIILLGHPGAHHTSRDNGNVIVVTIFDFQHVERFRNLKFVVIRITDIQSTVLSSSEGITAIHLAIKQRLINSKPSYYY